MNILVVGMHRSGTSLLSNLLSSMGVSFGKNLVKAGDSNPYGHYEDELLYKINDQLLISAKGSWDAPPSTDAIEKVWLDYEPQIIKRLDQLKYGNPIYGIKEPRISLFLDRYVSVIGECKIIYIRRESLDVAKSINKRDGIGINYGIKLSNYYNMEISKSIKKFTGELLQIDYEYLVTNREDSIRLLSEFIDIPLSDGEIRNVAGKIFDKKRIAKDAKMHKRYPLYFKSIKHPILASKYIYNRARRFLLRLRWYG